MTKNYEYHILPEYAPLYQKLPYVYNDYQKVSVYCRGNVDELKQFLPKEFDVSSDVFEVFILKNNEIDGLDLYSEGGIVIPCTYKNTNGACVAFEYVNTDDSLCAGREIWGYPKKLADVELKQEGEFLHGFVNRRGKQIIDISFKVDGDAFDVPNFSPRLQVKRLPHVEKDGTDMNAVILNTLQNVKVKKKAYGTATLNMEASNADPLANLNIKEVIGAVYIEGAFTLTYGQVLEDLQNK